MDMPPQFTAGRHEALIETLSSDMTQVKAAVARIENTLAEKRGERRTVLWFAGIVGAGASSLIAVLARHFKL
jgi:adenylylsulfate kinase-like enzyme